jgi:hypothetical protein
MKSLPVQYDHQLTSEHALNRRENDRHTATQSRIKHSKGRITSQSTTRLLSVSSSRPELQAGTGVLHDGTTKVIGHSRTLSLAESIPTSDIPFDDSDMSFGWNTEPSSDAPAPEMLQRDDHAQEDLAEELRNKRIRVCYLR